MRESEQSWKLQNSIRELEKAWTYKDHENRRIPNENQIHDENLKIQCERQEELWKSLSSTSELCKSWKS